MDIMTRRNLKRWHTIAWRIARFVARTRATLLDRLTNITYNTAHDTMVRHKFRRAERPQPCELMAELFKDGKAPDALVCANDIIAMQALKWLADNGHKVPEEVAVTGFDDILPARFATPPLTTVRQDYYEAGVAAAAQLRSMMDDSDNKRVQILRELPLVIRASTTG